MLLEKLFALQYKNFILWRNELLYNITYLLHLNSLLKSIKLDVLGKAQKNMTESKYGDMYTNECIYHKKITHKDRSTWQRVI